MVGRSGTQSALIRTPGRKKFFDFSASQYTLTRAPDHNLAGGRLGSQCSPIGASDRKKFLINQGVNEL